MKQITSFVWAGLAAATMSATSAVAGTPLPPANYNPPPIAGQDWQAVALAAEQAPGAVRPVGYHVGTTYGLPAGGVDGAVGQVPLPGYGPTIPQNYPVPKAGLYPSPIQTAPTWNGQTVITNQALAPHEMLYPHEYNAMYGPFYYKVKGHFLWTPFGMRTHEKWKLEGTQVNVKYHDRIRLFSGFHAPR